MVLFFIFKDFSLFLVPIFLAILIITGIIILLNKNSYLTLLWLPIIILFPVLGFIIYLLLGAELKKKGLFNPEFSERDHYLKSTQSGELEFKEELLSFRTESDEQIGVYFENFPCLLTVNNRVDVLADGVETFAKIENVLKEANDHIHLESYIIKNDYLGSKIKDILLRKAGEGVKVRVIYDWFGSLKLGKKYIRELKTGGVEVYPFLLVKRYFPFLHGALNYRNHRKIIVVDGRVGFLGGLNIGDEYIDANEYRYWRDTHLKIEGEAVSELQGIFFKDWHLVSGETLIGFEFFPKTNQVGSDPVQIITNDPDTAWREILQTYFAVLTSAQKYIYIATPYLIPDNATLTALKIAALKGVDVRIVIPGKPDKKIVYYATLSYAEELAETGVKIYCYQKGFIHTKTLVVDDRVCSVGTANFDCRSFYYNYEVNALIFAPEIIAKINDHFAKDLLNSRLLDLEKFKARPFRQKWLESAVRLFSPYL